MRERRVMNGSGHYVIQEKDGGEWDDICWVATIDDAKQMLKIFKKLDKENKNG